MEHQCIKFGLVYKHSGRFIIFIDISPVLSKAASANSDSST